MKNCFKIKYHWFLIIGMLFLSNYCIGQSFLTIPDSLIKANGRPFIVKLNPTSSIAAACTSQTIKLDIGVLVYLPGSNGPIPAGIVITPETNSGKTILTISGIVNDGKQGSSLLMDIAMQFKPGTCDYVKQEIIATTINVGCTVTSNQSGSATVTSVSPNNAEVKITPNSYPNGFPNAPICPRKVLKYRIELKNVGNQGFNNTDVKVNLELDKCATIIGIYQENTYISVNPVISSDATYQTAVFNTPDMLLSAYSFITVYDLFVTYPCISGNASTDCTSGLKDISVYLTGTKKDCGLPMKTIKDTSTIETTVSNAICGDVGCGTGSVGELDAIWAQGSYNLPCPSCAKNDPSYSIYLYIPPLHPSFPDRVMTIDIPPGVYVTKAFISELTACGTAYEITYIDAQGNRQATPFGGLLTRQVEFKTDCTISAPSTYFSLSLKYDEQNLPSGVQYLSFKIKFTSAGKLILETPTYGYIDTCTPNIYVYNQIRKTSQTQFENNYNASAIPGESLIYRLQVMNMGTGDTNNIANIKLDDKLIYDGGFKYAYDNNDYYYSKPLTPLLGENSFEAQGLGTVNVKVPTYGQTGEINLSGFNFPCTSKSLYIEFNVKVKDNVVAETTLPIKTTISGSLRTYSPNPNIVTIAAFTYVKSKMFVKCSLANEWNESDINVKNEEFVDFKMQFSNAGSTPVVLSELINLKPQEGDVFEVGSNSRKSTLKINYNCELPTISTNGAVKPSVEFKYAQNSVSTDKDMFCPPQISPLWTSSCDNSNWLKVSFLNNFTLLPGDHVDVIYKGKISGKVGTAFNSFGFKVNECKIVSANSNTLKIVNDSIGLGCTSCTLRNEYSVEMKNLFENLLKSIITRKIKNETDAAINGSSPAELLALKPYITNGGGNKIYNFVSTRNAENKITSIRFSFSPNSENDVTFLEEKGVNYNPEVGYVDPSYLRIDTTLYSSSEKYLKTCRKTLDANGIIISDCNSNTQVRHVDFCPTRFCYPMNGEIKIGD